MQRSGPQNPGSTAEQVLSRRILMLEQQVTIRLIPYPLLAALAPDGRGIGSTRASAVDGMERGVASLVANHSADADGIRALWSETVALRWDLALSAVTVAHREARRLRTVPGMTEKDLVQEGLIGLLAAAKRYDPDRDIRFATYARWWVRAEMGRALEASRLVRLPGSAVKQLRTLHREIAEREREGPWSLPVVADHVGIGLDRARELLIVGPSVSLDEAPEEGPASFLVDERVASPEAIVAAGQLGALLRRTMDAVLPERSGRIVALRYGLDEPPISVAEVAHRFSLSGERIRQIERASLLCLREATLDIAG